MNRLKWHDFLLIGISLVFAIATAVFVMLNFDKLPDKIPTNYDFSGNVTGYGSKNNIFVIIAMSFLMPVITTVCLFFPQLWNMPSVRAENLPRAMAITQKMIEGVTLLVTVLMAYLALSMTGLVTFSGSVLPITMIAIVLVLGIGFYKYMKLR